MIIYHDDNQNGIPHAHVVVNNTNLETGRRLQDPDPKALAASLQRMAEARGLRALRAPEPKGVAARAEKSHPRARPATYRSEYIRRADQELTDRGEYSWTADIGTRVRIARSVCRSEPKFRSLLASLGVIVADNSPRAPRRDWIYALADHSTRRVSGERLGLSYGRERLQPILRSGGMRRLADSSERTVTAIAQRAVEVGSLEELGLLSKAVALIEATKASSLADLDALAEQSRSSSTRDVASVVGYARAAGILPERRSESHPRKPASTRSAQTSGTHARSLERDPGDKGGSRALADVNGESLWLSSYYYESAQAYKDDPGSKGLPVARRRDGWSFLIADEADLQKLNRLTVDGETVLIQIEGELVDAAGFSLSLVPFLQRQSYDKAP